MCVGTNGLERARAVRVDDVPRELGGELGAHGREVDLVGDGVDLEVVEAGEHEECFDGAEEVEGLEAGEDEHPDLREARDCLCGYEGQTSAEKE